MATQMTVWFANGTEKYFDTQAKALNYEEMLALTTIIMATGLNEEASKKAAWAVKTKYTLTVKP